MSRVLVTGGAGFIGSHVVEALLQGSNHVIVLDNFNDFYSSNIKKKNIEDIKNKFSKNCCLEIINVDIRNIDKENIPFVTQLEIDTIIHLAAMPGVFSSIQMPHLYHDVNVKGTLNILELAKSYHIPKVIFASSSSVYGINPNVPWKETESVEAPISPYAATKVSGELLGNVYAQLYGINFVALRLFTVYGPRQRPDLAIHKFFSKIMHQKPIEIYGDGESYRDYTFVNDIANGFIAALNADIKGCEAINLGNESPIKLSCLLDLIEEVTGEKFVRLYKTPRAGDVPGTFASLEKARNLLNYKTFTDIQKGLEAQYQWMCRVRL